MSQDVLGNAARCPARSPAFAVEAHHDEVGPAVGGRSHNRWTGYAVIEHRLDRNVENGCGQHLQPPTVFADPDLVLLAGFQELMLVRDWFGRMGRDGQEDQMRPMIPRQGTRNVQGIVGIFGEIRGVKDGANL